jgi:uncharacterized protein
VRNDTDVERLINLVGDTPWFLQALNTVNRLELASWCIGAGVVRNLVWDSIEHGGRKSELSDVDVAYFDANNLSSERDQELQETLLAFQPDLPWEVTNQAAVHHWFGDYFGHEVPPLHSLHEAVASWPEYVTCVGVYLDVDDAVQVIAPFGLSDLFGMVVRHNPARASRRNFLDRVEKKQYRERWPRVTIIES